MRPYSAHPDDKHKVRTDLCQVLADIFLQVLGYFQREGASVAFPRLLHFFSVILGMSQRVVVLIQQLQLLDHMTSYIM